jgi:hypothetical protein
MEVMTGVVVVMVEEGGLWSITVGNVSRKMGTYPIFPAIFPETGV